MSSPGRNGPPGRVWYTIDEALDLLAVLEDAHDALVASRHLTVVLDLEPQVRSLNSKLGFDDPGGGDVD